MQFPIGWLIGSLLILLVSLLGDTLDTGDIASNARHDSGYTGYLRLALVGYGLGPTAVALFTDYVFVDENSLNLSIATIAITLGPLAALITWFGLKPYAASVVRAEQWNHVDTASGNR